MINYPLFKSIDDLPIEQVISLSTNDLPWVVITPNPQEADRVRLNLMDSSVVVKTMNGWQIELLRLIDEKLEFANKSHLIRDLAKIWRITQPEESFSQFSQAYQKLSEWRSFGTSDELIEGIIDFSQEHQLNSLKLLQNYLSQNEVIDEHRAFEIFNENIDETPSANYIFWGFTYFSPVQITFFQNLSELNELYYPMSESIFEEKQNQDWMCWLKGSANSLTNKPSENQGRIYLYQDISAIAQTLKNKNKIIISLSEESLSNTETSFLETKDYKTRFDLYPDKIQKIFTDLLIATINQEIVSLKQLKDYLEKCYWEAKEQKDWRELKVVTSLMEVSVEYQKSITELDFFDEFEVALFREIIELDSPRVSLLNQTNHNGGGFYWEKEFFSLSNKEIDCVYLGPGENIFRIGGNVHSVKLEGYLKSLGPVKRHGLGVEKKISRIKDYLFSGGSLYVNSSDYQDQSDWGDIFTEIEKVELIYSPDLNVETDEAVLESQKRINFSPSNIELYQTCPRKFYYSKILQYRFDFVSNENFSARETGNITHGAIKEHLDLNQLELNIKTTEKVFFEYLALNKIELSYSEINRNLPLIKSYVERALSVLRKLRKIDSEIEFYPEYVVENSQFGTSRADLLAISKVKRTFFIIDWKTGTIPTKKEITEYQKVQLPYYYQTLQDKFADYSYFLAYISLKDLQALTLSNTEFNEDLFEDSERCPNDFLENIEEKIKEIIEVISTDKKYLCRPSLRVCQYCDFKAICPRQE